jgi:hypothetical protein
MRAINAIKQITESAAAGTLDNEVVSAALPRVRPGLAKLRPEQIQLSQSGKSARDQ